MPIVVGERRWKPSVLIAKKMDIRYAEKGLRPLHPMKGNEIFLFAVSSNCDGVAKGEVAVSGFNDRVHFVSSMKAKEYSEECVLFL